MLQGSNRHTHLLEKVQVSSCPQILPDPLHTAGAPALAVAAGSCWAVCHQHSPCVTGQTYQLLPACGADGLQQHDSLHPLREWSLL